LLENLRTRTVSPSTHPRPASGGATDFPPASALSIHQQALRPPGGEDARCVQPMSATQTNCVHPHLARSRLTLATFAARTSRGVLGSARQDRGPNVSRRSKTASADRHATLRLVLLGLATDLREPRAWAFSSHGADAIEPLTPLSQSPLVHPHASPTFVGAASCPYGRLLVGSYGSEDGETA